MAQTGTDDSEKTIEEMIEELPYSAGDFVEFGAKVLRVVAYDLDEVQFEDQATHPQASKGLFEKPVHEFYKAWQDGEVREVKPLYVGNDEVVISRETARLAAEELDRSISRAHDPAESFEEARDELHDELDGEE